MPYSVYTSAYSLLPAWVEENKNLHIHSYCAGDKQVKVKHVSSHLLYILERTKYGYHIMEMSMDPKLKLSIHFSVKEMLPYLLETKVIACDNENYTTFS